MDTFLRLPDGTTLPEEDFELFLSELGELLNKYHYIFDKAKFYKFATSDIRVVKFLGNNEFIYPQAEQIGDENE
jgi:hypothetical protein